MPSEYIEEAGSLEILKRKSNALYFSQRCILICGINLKARRHFGRLTGDEEIGNVEAANRHVKSYGVMSATPTNKNERAWYAAIYISLH